MTPLGDGTAYLNCECSLPGYVAVYLFENSTPLIQIPEVFAFKKSVRIK